MAAYRYRNPEPVLVDVGAHRGSFSRRFAQKGWRILAFEPEHKNFDELRGNLNGFPNVDCFRKAVSEISGEMVPFYVSDVHPGIHSLKAFHETHELGYEVETVSLNDILQDLKLYSVTLLKIDIEGADFLALKGFDVKTYSPEMIMVEFMDERSVAHYDYDHHDVVAYMKEQGYIAFVSEWAPIEEYGRGGVIPTNHVWLQCVPYPLDHEPAWGNLLFVPVRDRQKFIRSFDQWLRRFKWECKFNWVLRQILRIPGVKSANDFMRDR